MSRRDVWSAGDLEAITKTIAQAGPRLVERAGVTDGMRVLDVGTGTGEAVAVPAARRGAEVVGADLTDEWFGRARAHAAEAGVEIQWIQADVEGLPFEDGRFDRVLSSFGHIFAPHHELAAAEMTRVTAPGGLIATAGWTPDGFGASLLEVFGRHLPPAPDGAQPPALWGVEEHAREMFGRHGLGDVVLERGTLRMWDGPLDQLLELYEQTFGPAVLAREAVGPDGWQAVREQVEQTILAFARPSGDGAAITLDADYVTLVATR